MNISGVIDKLNNELDKLNKMKNGNVDTSSFFTDNEHFNDDVPFEITNANPEITDQIINNTSNVAPHYPDIEPNDKAKDLVIAKENRLISAEYVFKKSIKISLKAFLISISLSFLNLFI